MPQLPTPAASGDVWGNNLNRYLTQLTDNANGGAINSWTTATRPSSPENGRSGLNRETANLEQWDGTQWLILTVNKDFQPVLLWDFNKPYVGQIIETPNSSFFTKNYNPVEWTNSNCISKCINESILKVITTGADPYILKNFTSLERFKGADYNVFKMRYRYVKSTTTAPSEGAFYFTTGKAGFGENQSFPFSLLKNSQWHVLEINLSSNALWMDDSTSINSIRIDPSAGAGEELEIDYIAIGRYATDLGLSCQKANDTILVQTAPAFFSEAFKVQSATHGTFDNGAVASIIANPRFPNIFGTENPALIVGFENQNQSKIYSDRDSVSLYVENSGPSDQATAKIISSSAIYTANSVRSATPIDLSKIQIGMLVDTQPSAGPKSTGFVTNVDQESNTVFVDAWYETVTGNVTLPANNTAAVINPITKIWAHNANVFLFEESQANAAAGFELGIINSKSAAATTWGFDCVNLGTFKNTVAFIQRGRFAVGFQSDGNADVNFRAESNPGSSKPGIFEFYDSAGNGGPRQIGEINFSTQSFPNTAQIKCNTSDATDDHSQLTFHTSRPGDTRGERMRITKDGNVGIANTNPTQKLHVQGNILASGNIVANSDATLKTKINPIQNALKSIIALTGVNFFWKTPKNHGDNPDKQVGLIAQEVEKVIPEAVITGSDGIKSLNYSGLTGVLVEAIKEQQKLIDELKSENQKLASRLDRAGL